MIETVRQRDPWYPAEMGNALGFVRMIRQAGLRHCTAALDIVDSQPASRSAPLSPRNLRRSQQQPSTPFASPRGGPDHPISGGGTTSGLGSEDRDIEDVGDGGAFEERGREAGLSGRALQAAIILDATLAELQAHATEGEGPGSS